MKEAHKHVADFFKIQEEDTLGEFTRTKYVPFVIGHTTWQGSEMLFWQNPTYLCAQRIIRIKKNKKSKSDKWQVKYKFYKTQSQIDWQV